MKGIYLWTNLINGKKYVGKSDDIASRKRGYRKEVSKGSDRYIIKALRKHGFENFSFEVLEEVDNNILEREQYWMDFYDTLNKDKGYNILRAEQSPGESFSQGSKNHKAKLTEDEVYKIRVSIFIDKQEPLVVYSLYKDRISYDTFCKVYRGQTWKKVDTSMIYDLTKFVERKGKPKAKLTIDDVKSIRLRAKNGENYSQIFLDYSEICGRNTIKRIVEFKTWKNV